MWALIEYINFRYALLCGGAIQSEAEAGYVFEMGGC